MVGAGWERGGSRSGVGMEEMLGWGRGGQGGEGRLLLELSIAIYIKIKKLIISISNPSQKE